MLPRTPEEERWRLAQESASFGVWDLDPRLDQVHYSPAWKARLGLPTEDAAQPTRFWRSRVHPDDLNPMLHALRSHLDGSRATYEMQFRLRCGHGRFRHVLSRGRVVERDPHGAPLRMVGTMVELGPRTEPAPLHGPLADSPSRMSHELRTPLHAILGLSQLLEGQLGTMSEADQRAYLGHIQEAGWRLLGLVDDLLDAATRDGADGAAPRPGRR